MAQSPTFNSKWNHGSLSKRDFTSLQMRTRASNPLFCRLWRFGFRRSHQNGEFCI